MKTAPASRPALTQQAERQQSNRRQVQRRQAGRQPATRHKQSTDQHPSQSTSPPSPTLDQARTGGVPSAGGPAPAGRPDSSAPHQSGRSDFRWLNVDEQRIWRAYVHATMLLDDHLDRHLQREAAMPHIYYGLLLHLADAPQRRLRMTELAMQAKITRSRLSHAIARLEKNGWVRRENCPSDKRGQFAVLTDEGFGVLDRAAPSHVAAVRQALFDRLNPEQQKSLGEIMHVIAEGLQPTDAGADLPWLR